LLRDRRLKITILFLALKKLKMKEIEGLKKRLTRKKLKKELEL
jgi:hypothetical protein